MSISKNSPKFMSNSEHFFDESIENNVFGNKLPSPNNSNMSVDSSTLTITKFKKLIINNIDNLEHTDNTNNTNNTNNLVQTNNKVNSDILLDSEEDMEIVSNSKKKKSIKLSSSNFKLNEIQKWAKLDADLETMIKFYQEIIHPNISSNDKPNVKVLSLILKFLIRYCRHDILKFLRENYSKYYLDINNYDYLNYTPFQNLFWINEDHHVKILNGSICNFPKDIDSIKKTIYEINQYGLADTIFKKCLIKNKKTDLHPTKFENIFTIIDDPGNYIGKELRNNIFKYVTEEYDYSNIEINGQKYNFVKNFIKYCLVEDDINCSMCINELFFFLKRFDIYAIKIFTMTLIEKFQVNNIKYKNNKKINNIINIICSKKNLSHGYSEYFAKTGTNINNFKSYILETIISNYEQWIEEWIEEKLSSNGDISEYNKLIQQGYRNIFCILGNFYYYDNGLFNKDYIISSINDKIFKEIPYIEHSILYFIANSGINLNNPTYNEKIFISNIIRMYCIDNINSSHITKVYIMDTIFNLTEKFNIKTYY
jgi:hypothetical protein